MIISSIRGAAPRDADALLALASMFATSLLNILALMKRSSQSITHGQATQALLSAFR